MPADPNERNEMKEKSRAETPSPRELLERHGLRAKHPFGQNFLADARIARQIAELADDAARRHGDRDWRGSGCSHPPAARPRIAGRRRRARPRSRTGAPRGPRRGRAAGRLVVLEADAKQVDYGALLDGVPSPRAIAGNLPYQLTGPLLRITVEHARRFDRAVYMVQLEVAERLVAKPSEAEYGALTVFVTAALDVERKIIVRRGSFYPQPRVDSAVVVLTPRTPPLCEETEEFRAVVKAAFAQRRKTLRNAWRALADGNDERIPLAAERARIDLDARGETLDAAAFARMANELSRTRA